MTQGRFITYEGGDGAGKSGQIQSAADYLRQQGIEVIVTREPGGTPLGEKLRALLLTDYMHLETEAMLMFAGRREHLAQVIVPALERGAWVLSDRFSDASFAYQVGGRGLDRRKFDALEALVHPGLQPDLTLLFDVPVDVAMGRIAGDRQLDRFELEKRDFHQRVRDAYLTRAGECPRIAVIDAAKPIEDVARAVREKLQDLVGAWLIDRNLKAAA